MLLRNNAFFPVKIFPLFTWFFGIILLTKRFFWKNNFGFGRSIFKILCRIYDGRPDLHRIGHLDRRVKNIYFKARNGRWPILRGALLRFKERFFIIATLNSCTLPSVLPHYAGCSITVTSHKKNSLMTKRMLQKIHENVHSL